MENEVNVEEQVQIKIAATVANHEVEIAEERAKGLEADHGLIRDRELDIEHVRSAEMRQWFETAYRGDLREDDDDFP